MIARLATIAVLALLAAPASAQTTKPAAPDKDARAAARKAWKEIEADSTKKCDGCNGSGRVTVTSGRSNRTEKCSCTGGRTRAATLEIYVRLLPLDTELLANGDRERAESLKQLALRNVQAGCTGYRTGGPYTSGIPGDRPRQLPGWCGEQHERAAKIILSKSNPAGRSLAFNGVVEANAGGIATVVFEAADLGTDRDGPAFHRVRVRVPGNVRWPISSEVFVIGTVESADSSSVLIAPLAGTR